jgi:hypothetical protein
MTTLGELQGKILRLLDDAEGVSYSDDSQLDAIQAAHIAILPWQPKPSVSLLSGDGSVTAFTVPTDYYEAQAIIVQATGEILPSAVFQPGSYHGTGVDSTNDWIEYPSGSITFSKVLGSSEVYELWYSAYWTAPTDMDDEEFELEVPESVITGMSYFSSAYLLTPGAIGAAEIRQFNIRVDSGNPEHNPVRDATTYLTNLFIQEMNRLPKFQRMQR